MCLVLAGCLLFVFRWLLFVVCRAFGVGCCLLLRVVCRLSFGVWCLVFSVLVFGVRCLMLGVCVVCYWLLLFVVVCRCVLFVDGC